MTRKRNRFSTIGLAGLAVAGAIVATTLAAEQWTGIIKTDMASLLTPRDVSQSTVIPAPEPTFGGVIDKDAYKSTAWWPPAIAPKKGSPNVLLVLIDDEGFAANSSFGGLIPTPTSDQLAKEGCATRTSTLRHSARRRVRR